MTEFDARRIAAEFAASNAKCVYGPIVRAILLVEEQDTILRIEPKDAGLYSGKKQWSISFDLMQPEMIPRDLVVVVDDATGDARFFLSL